MSERVAADGEDQIRRTTARSEKVAGRGAYNAATCVGTFEWKSTGADAPCAEGSGTTGSGTGDCSQHSRGAALTVSVRCRGQQPWAEAALGIATHTPTGTQGSQERRMAPEAARTQAARGRTTMREGEHGCSAGVKVRMVKRCGVRRTRWPRIAGADARLGLRSRGA